MEPYPTKFSIKIKRKQNDIGASTDGSTSFEINHKGISPGHQDGNIGEQNDSTCHDQQGSAEPVSPSEVVGDITEDKDDQCCANSQNQLVVYKPDDIGTDEIQDPEPIDCKRPRVRKLPAKNQASRLLPFVGAFAVQCAECFKWRLIPTQEKYEEIREHISQKPFICEAARGWNSKISCDDEPDIVQDNSRLWAIDKPNIAKPPAGWQRLLHIRGLGGTKFADVYYLAPSGKKLRSAVEIQKYLDEHPNVAKGVDISKFSFITPRPLQENYVRKRTPRSTSVDERGMGMPGHTEPTEANPIAWVAPGEAPDVEPQNRSTKRPKVNSVNDMHQNHQE